MRFIAGTDLRVVLAEEGALPPARAVEIVSAVAAGLDAAHAAGLVHRDVKPANVLLATDADRPWAYLTDFGLTKEVSSQSGITISGQWVGTVDYIAPEQLEHGQVDAPGGRVRAGLRAVRDAHRRHAVQRHSAPEDVGAREPPTRLRSRTPPRLQRPSTPSSRRRWRRRPRTGFSLPARSRQQRRRSWPIVRRTKRLKRAPGCFRDRGRRRAPGRGFGALRPLSLPWPRRPRSPCCSSSCSPAATTNAEPGPTDVGTRVVGTNGDDSLAAGPGADRVEGLGGDDNLDGGAGPDSLAAGAGDDVILASDDNAVDTIACGPGRDLVAQPDARDILEPDCEEAGWTITAEGPYRDRMRVAPRVAGRRVTFEARCHARCEGSLELRTAVERRLLGLGGFELDRGRWGSITAALNDFGLEYLRQRRRVRVVKRGRRDCRCPNPPPFVDSGFTTRLDESAAQPEPVDHLAADHDPHDLLVPAHEIGRELDAERVRRDPEPGELDVGRRRAGEQEARTAERKPPERDPAGRADV